MSAKAAHECWWLSPTERALAEPEIEALRTWHESPEQAIAARSACTIGVLGVGPVRQALLSALATARLRVAEPTHSEVLLLADVHTGADLAEEIGDRPHLPVRIATGWAHVGPIVIPGRTPCLRCRALHERDARSSQWLAPEHLSTMPADPLVTMVAVTAAVAMLRQWIDSPGCPPALWWAFEVPSLLPRMHQAHPHPSCGCLWQA